MKDDLTLRIPKGAPLTNEEGDANFSRLMYWSGPWVAGTYEPNEVVLDGEWLMICNNLTTERAGPQASGDPTWDLPDVPAFVEQTFTGVAWTGHEYTLTQPGWITGLQVWVPELTADTNYRFILIDNTDPAAPIITTIEEPVLVENDWTTLRVTNAPFPAGAVLAVIIDALNSGSDTTVSGGWNRAVNNNTITADPGLNAWGTNNAETSIRVNKTDLDSTDRTTELMGIGAGSTITFAETLDSNRSMQWYINGDPIDQGTHISWANVSFNGPGTGGEPIIGNACTMTALVPVPASTRYEEIVGGAPTPTWATVQGLKRLGGTDQPATSNAYGVRLLFQPAYVSPDWDIVSRSA